MSVIDLLGDIRTMMIDFLWLKFNYKIDFNLKLCIKYELINHIVNNIQLT